MSDSQLPSNVHLLRPRTTSLSDRLDRFLEQHALARDETPIRRDPTRPKAPGINAVRCAACEQMEYLSRDYCRCGHYLRGQLEDEFLAWERQITEEHERLAESVELQLKKVRYQYLISLPFVVVPLIYMALMAQGFRLLPMVSIATGFCIMGLCVLREKYLLRPVIASWHFLNSYSADDFIQARSLKQNG